MANLSAVKLSKINAVNDFVKANPFSFDNPVFTETPSLLGRMFGGIEQLSNTISETAGNLEEFVGNIADFDHISDIYSGDINIEDRLDMQFQFSTLVLGQVVNAELSLNGDPSTLSSDFVSNSYIKAGLVLNTDTGIAFASQLDLGIVQIDFNVDFDSLDGNIEDLFDVTVMEMPTIDSLSNVILGVAQLFDLPPEINMLIDLVNYVELGTFVLGLTVAAASGTFSVALLDPEPISKIVLLLAGILLSVFTRVDPEKIRARLIANLKHANEMLRAENDESVSHQLWHLYCMYEKEYLELSSQITFDNLPFNPTIAIDLVGTTLVVSTNFALTPDIEFYICEFMYELFAGQIVLSQGGRCASNFERSTAGIAKALAKTTFVGGFYVR